MISPAWRLGEGFTHRVTPFELVPERTHFYRQGRSFSAAEGHSPQLKETWKMVVLVVINDEYLAKTPGTRFLQA